jgi:hypothetical protein
LPPPFFPREITAVLAIFGGKRILRKWGDIVAIQCSKTIIYCKRYAVAALAAGEVE